MISLLLGGGLALATGIAFLVYFCVRNADLADRNLEDDSCDCADCNRGPATLDEPHTDPNSCCCPQCLAVIDIVKSIVFDDAWDRAVVAELGGTA